MDKAVIDELFEQDAAAGVRHGEDEIQAVLNEKSGEVRTYLSRIEEIKGELNTLKEGFEAAADELKDLYDDLELSQQSGSGEALKTEADECAQAAEELNAPIDALSDLLLFRFR